MQELPSQCRGQQRPGQLLGPLQAVPLAALALVPAQGGSWWRRLAASPQPSPSPWEVRNLALCFAPAPPPAALPPPAAEGPGVTVPGAATGEG